VGIAARAGISGFIGIISEQVGIVLSKPVRVRIVEIAFAAQAIATIRIDRLTA